MSRARGIREAGLALIVAALVLALTMIGNSAALRGLETASLDLRFRIRGAIKPGAEVAVVLVDDRSLATYGRWPFSRKLFAKAVGALDGDGAKEIVFDLLFTEPEQPIPPDLRSAAATAAVNLPSDANAPLRAALQQLASENPDRDLAVAIHTSGRVLLPFAFSFSGTPETDSPDFLSAAAYSRFDRSPVPPIFPLQPVAALVPVPVLATQALGLGHVIVAYDVDGAPRYDYAALPFNGDFLPSLPVRAAATYLGIPWDKVGLALGAGINVGPIAIPTDRAMRILINYRGPRGTIPTYSFVDLLEGRVPPGVFKDRIVLVGASFIGIADTNASPFGNTQLPGTERMANIIDTILQRDFIRESPSPWTLIVVLAVLVLAALTGASVATAPTRTAVLAGVVPLALWCVGVQWAFVHGLWLPMVNPLTALVASTVAVLAFRYGVADAEGRAIKSAFRHYLSPEMVNVLAANPDRLQLGGETRAMTLLFCDVRGFTSISERFKSNPQGLTRLINRFLTPMTDVIMARRGTIDKYMGDCVMAFWNAPLDDTAHALHACESALAMLKALEGVNATLKAEAEAENRPFEELHVGVGVNSGECVVGNMGSDQRFDYSVLGDAVNLASRLEGQTKTYHVGIIIGETTRAAAPDLAALELDRIAVKGKAEGVTVYALLGDAALAATDDFKAHAGRHDTMLARYRAQDWPGAHEALARCRGDDPALDLLYDLYAERIRHYAASPPGPDWDGVFIAETK